MFYKILPIVILVLAAGMVHEFFTPEHEAPASPLSLAGLVDFDAFPPLSGRHVSLPRDHGGHPEAPLEAWQVQGILTTAEGRRLGFQLHILSLALRPGSPARSSAWGTHRLFLAYFTRAEFARQAFQVELREERAALGLSGAGDHRVWVDDWALDFGQDGASLRAGKRGGYLALSLRPSYPPSLEEAPGLRAYRLRRMVAQGLWGSEPVTGSAWLEHAWGMLPLPGGPVSVQRFQVQLDDGRELFCLEFRRRGAARPGPGRCLLREPDAAPRHLDAEITVTSSRRTATGKRYPTAWRLASTHLQLDLTACIPDQLIPGPIPWWSGWVTAQGMQGEHGEGFVQVFQ